MRLEHCSLLLVVGCFFFTGAQASEKTDREGKVLPLFQIVRFPNDACVGSASKNGTCYTSEECSSRGGTNAGSCAQGYGVCCTFTVSCGSSSSENCTYFESTGSEIGGCQVEICRCNSNVCQLRLDFNQFQITGPSTSTVSVAKVLNGDVVGATAAGLSATSASQCLTDTFSVTSPGGGAPPSICGINTGEHMYVDSHQACNDLTFQLGQTGVGANIGTRTWSIKVTQYSCDYPNLAPPGCTQYFFGSNSQTVQTYNFAGGQHLANQDQNICVRRERGNCRICWTTIIDTDFAVSSTSAASKALNTASAVAKCCGYGTDGLATSGPDCVVIPGAVKVMTTTKIGASRFCGRNKGLGSTGSTAAAKTICSDRTPFNIRFLSDTYELAASEAKVANAGFRLAYIQSANNC